jgi:hypothetical protein
MLSILPVVLVEVRGLRNRTVPLEVSMSKPSKSASSSTKSGAVAVLVKVRVVPSVIVLFEITASVGAVSSVLALAVFE